MGISGAQYSTGDPEKTASPTTEVSSLREGHVRLEDPLTTQRGLASRHAQMIALGGCVGTGLLVNTSQALAAGGPAILLSTFIVNSCMVYCMLTCMVEVAAYLPINGGSMSLCGTQYVSSSLGFALGYLYWYSLGILVPYELVAAGVVIDYWPNSIPIAVWISVLAFVVVALNFLPVRFYGETEFWFAGLKVILIVGLLILSFILCVGGGPSGERLGFRYWNDPGPAKTMITDGSAGYFVAFWSVLIMNIFPFTFGPELIIATSGEMQSPRRNLPTAARRYFGRVVVFYVLGALAMGIICPSNDSRLGLAGSTASPWVIGIVNAGIEVLPSIVNAVILMSSWSSSNSFLYLSSRSLYSLSVQGNAPRIFRTCNRWGVPYYAVAASACFCGLAYLNVTSDGRVVFNWFINITNTGGMTSWICCCIIYFRFRKATDAQGVDRPYKSFIQPYGAYIALIFFSITLLTNGFAVFWPGRWSTNTFLTSYVGIPIFLALYLGHRLLNREQKWAHDPLEVDLHTGLAELIEAETPPVKRTGWKVVMRVIE